MLKQKQNITLILVVNLLLGSCSNHVPAPVFDISSNADKFSTPKSSPTRVSKAKSSNQAEQAQSYKVMPGDTLFSIAWRYSLDYKMLAEINHLDKYRIYPGQQLRLNPSSAKPLFSPRTLVAAINTEVLNKKASNSQSNPISKQKRVNESKKPQAAHQAKKRNPNYRTAKTSGKSSIKRWIWPVDGKVINHFSTKSNQNKGVDIAAKLGTPVRATAKGRVVYSGSGLRGYGHLVIIKHNDNYLSAYAHNNKIHVAEDEFVKAGQKIADLGSSGADREKLHFEIRYKGKPVDPLNYLPKSGLL